MYLTYLLLMYLGQTQGLNKEIWGRMSKRLLLGVSPSWQEGGDRWMGDLTVSSLLGVS